MKTPIQWITKLATFIALFTSTSSAFAAGGTVTFTSATGVPTLSGTMLIVLSLLLFVVALKISRQKGHNTGKFFMLLIGASALISGTGGVKLLSDVHAGLATTTIVENTPYTIPANSDALYFNDSGQPLNFRIVGDTSPEQSICGYEIFESESAIPPGMLANPAAPTHSGLLPDGQYLLVRCFSIIAEASDERLKQNIKVVKELDSGIRLYSFNYKQGFGLDSQTPFVGVMAQDLLKDSKYKHAVTFKENGFYAVNYASLGLRMITQDEWQISNENVFIKPVKVAQKSVNYL